MPLQIKLKLQWFKFPKGVVFDGKKLRTTKMSRLFKLKQLSVSDMSFNVRHSGLNYEHLNSAKFPVLHSDKSVVWDEVGRELRTLAKIIHAPEPVEQEFSLAE